MRTKIYFLRGENRFVRYVGKTSGTLNDRLCAHLCEARSGKKNHRCNGIRSLLRKGISPTIDLITEVEGNGAGVERTYIKWLRSKGVPLWNGTDGGEGCPGLKHTGMARLKMGLTRKGRHHSKEAKLKIGLSSKKRTPWIKGRHHTDRTKKLMREARKNQIPWIKGKHHSEESKEKMREKLKGRFFSEITRKKISDAGKGRPSPNKGKPMSEAQKIKIREAHLRRWEKMK